MTTYTAVFSSHEQTLIHTFIKKRFQQNVHTLTVHLVSEGTITYSCHSK